MTKFGMGLTILAVALVLIVGFLAFGTPSTPPVVTHYETPAPVDTTPSAPLSAEFDKSVSLNIGDKIVFSDGLTVELKEINDSRCKPNVQCFWQGELGVVLTVSGSSANTSAGEVRLGTVLNKTAMLKGYTFTLGGATEIVANIVVSQAKATSAGYVSGHVTIGPFCPVERADQPCKVPPEAYSSRSVLVYGSDKVTIKAKSAIDANGNYKITLAPGNYFVQISPAGIGPGEKKPVTIKASETTVIDFDIDTGIR